MAGEEFRKIIQKQQEEIESLKRRAEFLTSLMDMSIILTTTFNMDELIRGVLTVSQRVMNSEASNVMLYNEEKGLLECKVALGQVAEKLENFFTLPLGQGVAGWVAQNLKSVLVPDVSKDSRFYSGVDERTGFVTKSIIAAPLIIQDKLLGVAEVINPLHGRSFTEEDLQLFEVFCRGVSVAVQNAQMHQRLLENHRVEQQLEMASIIQQGFLPRSFSLKEDGKYEIAAVNLPASMVGGDLYDCIQLRPDLLGLTIGDVSGKGVPAALYMARLLSDFRFYAHQIEEPTPTMMTLNEMLTERSQQGMFVTMIYLTLDLNQGELHYVNGGHVSPILFRQSIGGLITLEEGKGIPLGILNPTEYKEQRLLLEQGDLLVLFSDGVLDAKSRTGQSFRAGKLEKLICSSSNAPADLISSLTENIRSHMDGVSQFDDITIIALKWR
jgi:sigma-B regulation protein RsbU (phosphoserine phosphatase)